MPFESIIATKDNEEWEDEEKGDLISHQLIQQMQ